MDQLPAPEARQVRFACLQMSMQVRHADEGTEEVLARAGKLEEYVLSGNPKSVQ